LTTVLSDPAVTVVVVEHGDRLTGFGFGRVPAWLAGCGRRIVVLDDAPTGDDLVGCDMRSHAVSRSVEWRSAMMSTT
jgi:predicted site-specific integrase-resolvase